MARVTGHSLSGSRQDVSFNTRTFTDIFAATGIAAHSGLDVGSGAQLARSALSQFTDCRFDSRRKHPRNREMFITRK